MNKNNNPLKGFMFHKVPPHDEKVERNVLAAIVDHPESYIRIATFFSPDIFYKEEHKVIAQAIYELNRDNKPIDLIMVTKKVLGISKDVDAYSISTILSSATKTPNIENWFLILVEYYVRRKILSICQQYQIKTVDMSVDALIMVSELAEQITNISNLTIFDKSVNPEEAVKNLIQHINERYNVVEKFRTIGIPELDEFVFLDAGDIMMVAGPGGTGKSKLVMHFAKSLMFSYEDLAIQYFSFEDPSNAILKNWLAHSCMLTPRQMDGKGYKVTEHDLKNITTFSEKYKGLDFTIISNPCYINDIKTSFINFCKNRPDKFNLLIIDNVMLLKDNDDKTGGTSVDDRIARTLKEISVETLKYNSAIIFLHHFTKESQSFNKLRTGYKPETIDVRGSSRYNDIALTTLLINKPILHPELVALYPGYEDMLRDLMIIETTKSRNGKTGFVRLFANLDYNIFDPIKIY